MHIARLQDRPSMLLVGEVGAGLLVAGGTLEDVPIDGQISCVHAIKARFGTEVFPSDGVGSSSTSC